MSGMVKRGAKRAMNLLLLAKEHCANWDPSYNRCCFAGPKFTECLLKDGERCGYFERAVLPHIAKTEDSDAVFHYRQALKQIRLKGYISAVQTNNLGGAIEGGVPVQPIETNLTPKLFKINKGKSSRMHHNGGPCTC